MSIDKFGSRLLIYSLLVATVPACYGQPAPEVRPVAETQTSEATPAPALIAEPDPLVFDSQLVNTESAARTLLLTNRSNSTLNGINAVTAGDFQTKSNCQALTVGASCALTVIFIPKHPGETAGSLTIFANPSDIATIPKVVLLKGTGLQHYNALGFFQNRQALVVLILAGFYFFGMVVVRWNMIAKRDRAELLAQIRSIRSWVETETSTGSVTNDIEKRAKAIRDLLDQAALPFSNGETKVATSPGSLPKGTRLFNLLFWARGPEFAGWMCIHQAEQQLVLLLQPERVRARMEVTEQELRQCGTSDTLAMANSLRDTAKASGTANMELCRSLLIEALGLLHAEQESDFNDSDVWHNKMFWLVGCALLFIIAVALVFQNAVLLLVGAVGGLLSRLSKNLRAADTPDDYGASWGSLFLSPLTGALAAWGGILLVMLAVKLNILGAALNFDWRNPYEPFVLAIALLLGFTERLFDDIATRLDQNLTSQARSTPSVPAKVAPQIAAIDLKPAPQITAIDPARVGQDVCLTVTGSNFQSGASAIVTGDHGAPAEATLEYKDASTVIVRFTTAGLDPYTSTLTVTNPDKQSATFEFKVVGA